MHRQVLVSYIDPVKPYIASSCTIKQLRHDSSPSSWREMYGPRSNLGVGPTRPGFSLMALDT